MGVALSRARRCERSYALDQVRVGDDGGVSRRYAVGLRRQRDSSVPQTDSTSIIETSQGRPASAWMLRIYESWGHSIGTPVIIVDPR